MYAVLKNTASDDVVDSDVVFSALSAPSAPTVPSPNASGGENKHAVAPLSTSRPPARTRSDLLELELDLDLDLDRLDRDCLDDGRDREPLRRFERKASCCVPSERERELERGRDRSPDSPDACIAGKGRVARFKGSSLAASEGNFGCFRDMEGG